VKAALGMLGLAGTGVRLPYVELDEDEAAVVRSLLERHGLLAPAHAG
jgi:dihydrodipicolinate synthase/N-acetylneuraminate lyase